MNIDDQIKRTKEEYDAYKASNFSCPEIIEWLRSVLESLYELKRLKENN